MNFEMIDHFSFAVQFTGTWLLDFGCLVLKETKRLRASFALAVKESSLACGKLNSKTAVSTKISLGVFGNFLCESAMIVYND